jgi:hypothetical protein
LFIFELECGEVENIIVTRNLRRQLHQVIVHEKVENGVAIYSNLSADQIDQQFVTPIRDNSNRDIHG